MSNRVAKIGLWAAAMIGINAMVGIGVITIPSMLALYVGPAGVFSYLIIVLVVLALGIALGRVALRYPGEGWTYLYPSKWAGHKIGIFSAVSYLIGVLVAMGFLIQQAGIWAHQFLPFISAGSLSLIIIFALMMLVLAGAEASSIGQFVIGACVSIPLLATGIVCWMHFDKALLTPFAPHGLGSIITTTPKALFALLGFECIVSLYSVVKEPSKNVPKAFIISILFVGGLYLFFTGGLLTSVPAAYFHEGLQGTLSSVLGKAFPKYTLLSTAVLIGAMFGIIGTLHSMLWSASAIFTDTLKRMKNKFAKRLIAKKIWNNRVSVILSTAIMVMSSYVFQAEVLIDLTAMLLILPSVLAVIALFFIPEEWKSGRNIIALVGFGGGLVMFYLATEGFLHSFRALIA